jgi:hypothetical protein
VGDQSSSPEFPPTGPPELELFEPIAAAPAEKAQGDAPNDLSRAPDPDPLAHRRAEPRLFAFLWTVYLIIIVLLGTAAMGQGGFLSLSALAPRARMILVAIVAGATIVCPMVRLSQARPARGLVAASLYDALVVTAPIQMVLWPLQLLVSWPWATAIGLAGLTVAWPSLMFAVVAFGLSLESRVLNRPGGRPRGSGSARAGPRAVWMFIGLALLAAGPAWIAGATTGPTPVPAGRIPAWVWYSSPFTSIYALTGWGLSGPRRHADPVVWTMLAIVAGLTLAVWAVAWATQLPDREYPDRVD